MAKDAKDRLSKMTVKELRAFASEHQIPLRGCRRKAEIIDALMSDKRIETLLKEEIAGEKKGELEEIEGEIEEIGEEVREVEQKLVELPPMADEKADPLLSEGRNLDVDFGMVEDFLDQARMRFEEGSFAKSLTLVREAVDSCSRIEGDFRKSAYSYAILAAEALIRECGIAGSDVDQAVSVLMRAKKFYRDGTIFDRRDVLMELEDATRELYSADIQRAKEQVLSTRRYVFEVGDLGADISPAKDMIQRAEATLEKGNYNAAVKRLKKAEELAKKARKERIKEIKDAIPATKSLIDEAEHVGADVEEAEKLLKQARIALRNRDYILCGELTKRAELSAMQSQHKQIEKAMELRRRQVENAQRIIMRIEPLIFEAEEYRIEVSDVKEILSKAKMILAEGDYVNGTMYAKEAEELARRIEPRIEEERRRRGIAKPTSGVCGECGSRNLEFYDNGWGKCLSCGRSFQWSAVGKKTFWEKVKEFLVE